VIWVGVDKRKPALRTAHPGRIAVQGSSRSGRVCSGPLDAMTPAPAFVLIGRLDILAANQLGYGCTR